MTHDPYTTTPRTSGSLIREREAFSTTIEDDGPKWRTVAVLAIAGALIIALTIAAILLIDAAQLDKRASLAIAEAARIAQETREARVFFWVVVWVSAALLVAGSAAAVLVILGARAYLALRQAQYAAIEVSTVARAPELLLSSRFRLIDPQRLKEGVPDASPGLPGDLRLETRSKSSTIQPNVQDPSGNAFRRRPQEQPK